MPSWKYVGLDKKRKKMEGTLEAGSIKDVRRQLRSQGIRPQKITPPSFLDVDLGEILIKAGLSKPFTELELLGFCRQLGVMLDAGVPILQGLELLYKSQKNPYFKKLIKIISEDVGGGKSLSDALNGKQGFDNVFINMIKAGEAGGVLSESLLKLVTFMEKSQKIKKAIKTAMIYPAMVILVGLGVITALMVFVIPRFTAILTSSGQEIPGITQLVIDTSDFIQGYAVLIFSIGSVSAFFLMKYIKTKEGKSHFDKFMMGVPIFGNIIIKGNLASFTRTLSTMLASGVPLIESLGICEESVDSSVVSKDIMDVRKSVSQGETMAGPLLRIKYFPEMVAQMVKIGEQTGEMEAMLEKTSSIFEEDVSDAVSNMTKLIEPLVIVFLGGIIAGLMLAMYLPIFMAAGGT